MKSRSPDVQMRHTTKRVVDVLVIDTNVLVSASLKADSAPAAILRILINRNALFAYDARILIEYRRVLSRPRFGFSPVLVGHLLRYLTDTGLAVAASPWPLSLPDPDDAKFLEVCLACGDQAHLITRNLRHYPDEARLGVSVLSPREWLNRHQAG